MSDGGFLKGTLCGEPARGGPCRRTLGHGGGHRLDGRERVVEREDHPVSSCQLCGLTYSNHAGQKHVYVGYVWLP